MSDAGADADALLEVADLKAWYGESIALHGMSFDVRRIGERWSAVMRQS